MLPRFVLFFWLTGHAAGALALSLGPIDTRSALYEKFSADIEVLENYGGEADDMRAALASPEDFDRMGVERVFFLSQLTFEVARTQSKTVIRIRGKRPITEPFMDFVVEVIWREGRMLREYTVLLDPPGFTPAAPLLTTKPAPKPATAFKAPPAPKQRAATNEYGPTRRNDTLWSIAERTRPDSGVTVQQQMLAIKRLNPDAFINDNINLLKQGQTLQIPNAEELKVQNPIVANRQVAREEAAWQAARATPLSASAETTTGRLRIVAQAGDRASGVSSLETDADDSSLASTQAPRPLPMSRRVNTLEQAADARIEKMRASFAAQGEALAEKDREIEELRAQIEVMQKDMEHLLAVNSKPAVAAVPPLRTETKDDSSLLDVLKQWWLFLALVAVALVLLLWAGKGSTRATQTNPQAG